MSVSVYLLERSGCLVMGVSVDVPGADLRYYCCIQPHMRPLFSAAQRSESLRRDGVDPSLDDLWKASIRLAAADYRASLALGPSRDLLLAVYQRSCESGEISEQDRTLVAVELSPATIEARIRGRVDLASDEAGRTYVTVDGRLSTILPRIEPA